MFEWDGDTKKLLSTLWIFLTVNYIYCDVFGMHDADTLQQLLSGEVGDIKITEEFLLYFAMIMQIPMNGGIHDAINLADKIFHIWSDGVDYQPQFDLYTRQRRKGQIDYVQAQSIRNKETLGETDPAKRAEKLAAIRRQSESQAEHDAFIRRACMKVPAKTKFECYSGLTPRSVKERTPKEMRTGYYLS